MVQNRSVFFFYFISILYVNVIGITQLRGDSDYFQEIDSKDLGAGHLKVISLQVNSRLEALGLKQNDQIIGVNGLRIRNLNEFYLYLWGQNHREWMLNVSRKDKRINLEAHSARLLDFNGVVCEDGGFEEFFKSLIQGTLPFDLQECSHISKLWAIECLRTFPGPGLNELQKLMVEEGKDREKALHLISIFLLLKTEEWEKAQTQIQNFKDGFEKGSFLDQVFSFYEIVIRKAQESEGEIRAKDYGVSPDFFAMSYPYPVKERTAPHEFLHFDQVKEDIYRLHTKRRPHFDHFYFGNGYQSDGDAYFINRSNHYKQIMWEKYRDKSIGHEYLRKCTKGFYFIKKHGGWPYRFSGLFNNDKFKLHEDLKTALEDGWYEPMYVHLFRLFPAIAVGDVDSFKENYEIIKKHDFKIMVRADDWISSMLKNNPNPEIRKVWEEIKKDNQVPAFYARLAHQQSVLSNRVSKGYNRPRWVGYDHIESYCLRFPNIVRHAVDEPWQNKLLDQDFKTKEQKDEVLNALTSEIMESPYESGIYPLLDHARKFNASQVMMAFERICFGVVQLNEKDAFFDIESVLEYFDEMNESLQDERIELWANLKGEEQIRKLLELEENYGVPDVLIRLSQAAKRVGHEGHAKRMLKKAVQIYLLCVRASGDNAVAYRAVRKLCFSPSTSPSAEKFIRNCGEYMPVYADLYQTVIAIHQKDWMKVAAELTSIQGSNLKSTDFVLYEGQVYEHLSHLIVEKLPTWVEKGYFNSTQLIDISKNRSLQELFENETWIEKEDWIEEIKKHYEENRRERMYLDLEAWDRVYGLESFPKEDLEILKTLYGDHLVDEIKLFKTLESKDQLGESSSQIKAAFKRIDSIYGNGMIDSKLKLPIQYLKRLSYLRLLALHNRLHGEYKYSKKERDWGWFNEVRKQLEYDEGLGLFLDYLVETLSDTRYRGVWYTYANEGFHRNFRYSHFATANNYDLLDSMSEYPALNRVQREAWSSFWNYGNPTWALKLSNLMREKTLNEDATRLENLVHRFVQQFVEITDYRWSHMFAATIYSPVAHFEKETIRHAQEYLPRTDHAQPAYTIADAFRRQGKMDKFLQYYHMATTRNSYAFEWLSDWKNPTYYFYFNLAESYRLNMTCRVIHEQEKYPDRVVDWFKSNGKYYERALKEKASMMNSYVEELKIVATAESRFELGQKYETGGVVEKDLDEALYWYELAMYRNYPGAKKKVDELNKALE